MSTERVRHEITKFLESKEASCLCIRGKWGVGKTYTWRTLLEAGQKNKIVKFARYSYVSLFGMESLQELKFSIFENIVTLGSGKLNADIDTLDNLVNSKVGSWRKLVSIGQSLPVIRGFTGADLTTKLSFLTIRDQIVCFDDLERRGKSLSIDLVLGLASYLKEQRNCKIVVLLNDQELEEKDRISLGRHLEKVVDVSVVYDPSSNEAVEIALGAGKAILARSAELCKKLQISNIRVINKVDRALREVRSIVGAYDPKVFEQISHSVALFSWAFHQPGEAPSIEFLRDKKSKALFGHDKEALSPLEIAWNALLDAYGYIWTDGDDKLLISQIVNGYFDPISIQDLGKKIQDATDSSRATEAFKEAWNLYHGSFANNQEQVIAAIYKSFVDNILFISPMNLDGTVRLFRELGCDAQANEMIALYIQKRVEQRDFFDLSNAPFGDQVTDAEIRNAFGRKLESFKEVRQISELIDTLNEGWSDETLSALSGATIAEYVDAFKSSNGPALKRLVAGALYFDRVANATDQMRAITEKAKVALREIAGESKINASRMKKYGILLEAKVSRIE